MEKGDKKRTAVLRPIHPAGRAIGQGSSGKGKTIRPIPGLDQVRLATGRGRQAIFEGVLNQAIEQNQVVTHFGLDFYCMVRL